MEDSKYIDCGYDVFRDMFYDLDNIEDAVDMFTYTFDRSGDEDADIDTRRRYAKAIYEYMTN